jgi:cytoskeleton protein RodZ
MNEASTGSAMSAGRLLRQAREAKGLQIDALASAIKVTPRKLELLEADRFDQLVDPTFTRALAQTVCRSLKIEATPVLALLPGPNVNRLGEAGRDLNAPFHEAAGLAAGGDGSPLARPAIWGPLLLLIIAAGVYFVPSAWLGTSQTRRATAADPVAAPGADSSVAAVVSERLPVPAPAAGEAAPSVAVSPVAADAADAAASTALASAPPSNADAVAPRADASAAVPAKLLQVHATAQSWVEVIDVRGQSLLSRIVQAGENVELDGVAPLKVKIGNAAATEIVFRGQPLALAPFTRDNLARLELK